LEKKIKGGDKIWHHMDRSQVRQMREHMLKKQEKADLRLHFTKRKVDGVSA